MKYSLANIDVRLDIRKSGFRQYDVARQMKVSESYLSRILREPLSQDDRERIYNAIYALTHQNT